MNREANTVDAPTSTEYAQVDGKPRRLVCCLPVKRHFNSLFALFWNFNLSLACTLSIILHPPARIFLGPFSVIYLQFYLFLNLAALSAQGGFSPHFKSSSLVIAHSKHHRIQRLCDSAGAHRHSTRTDSLSLTLSRISHWSSSLRQLAKGSAKHLRRSQPAHLLSSAAKKSAVWAHLYASPISEFERGNRTSKPKESLTPARARRFAPSSATPRQRRSG
ncbi:uncharacterized protein CLUP02_11219 [Colletotrichum lupini]|uniref:Transmembrane protein n=1 Tax=Colletotrichum lupini TaxID=145971 RepID=A0A9Q8SZ04_9PEZI|nr:uncharacterized protein CLUP02_11219 [Colletotrichum lupini]UQC85720.1 hypothetical protein CLUP02_11219 [Colletotrichum lupini]